MKFYLVPNSDGKLVKVGAEGFVPKNSIRVPKALESLPDEALEVVDGKVQQVAGVIEARATDAEIDLVDAIMAADLAISLDDAVLVLISAVPADVAKLKAKVEAKKIFEPERIKTKGEANYMAIVKDGGLYSIKAAKKGFRPAGFVCPAPSGFGPADDKFLTITEANGKVLFAVDWAGWVKKKSGK